MRPFRHPHHRLTAMALAAALTTPAGWAAQQKPAPGKATPSQAASPQRSFATPEEAAEALVAALRAGDTNGTLAVLGPDASSWLLSGDEVEDANDRKKFLAAYDEKHALQRQGNARVLVVGNDDWPFPAPLVQQGSRWSFDAAAGKEEILNRRIGANELDTIQTLLAIVDAQREYAAQDADRNGFADYARRFRSTPGKKDGLYWKAQPGETESPLGMLVASAALEGYGEKIESPEQSAFHGYRFRLLSAQGKDASGGAYDYLVGDRLLGGFAVVAYPAAYGVSGVTTFLVNHEGVVYEKDLGPQTSERAAALRTFNPDASWKKVQ
jgi:hypothetical protein